MTSTLKSGSSRRKAETPGKIRIQLKGKNSKVINSEDEEDPVVDSMKDVDDEEDDESDNLPVSFDNGIPEDLPEGTFIVQPEPVEDSLVKKKREAVVRIDTSVLDNVSCTACGRQVNPYKSGALQKHPVLKVVICKRCEKFLSSGEIAKDKDGTDEQCQWCGEGGRLVVCDECASAFCKACVMRNFNRSEFNNINGQQKWKCYLCNKAPLQGLRENYRKIRDTLKALQEKDKAKAGTLAANPTNNGTQPSEKSAGSKQISNILPPSSVMKGGNMTSVFSAQKSSSSFEGMRAFPSSCQKSNSESGEKLPVIGAINNITFNLEDTSVTLENVFGVVDKLVTATNSFREMLQVLQSQSQFPVSGNTNIHSLRLRCVKALNMGLENYLKSLKTILPGSPYLHQNMTHVAYKPDIFQANLTGLDPTSSISASEAFVLSRLSASPGFSPMGPNLSHHSNGDFIDSYLAQPSHSTLASINRYIPEIKQEINTDSVREKVTSAKENNNSLISEKYSFKQGDKDSHKMSKVTEEKSIKLGSRKIENDKTCKDSVKSTKEGQVEVFKINKEINNKDLSHDEDDSSICNASGSKTSKRGNIGSGEYEKTATEKDRCTNAVEEEMDEQIDSTALDNLSNKLMEKDYVPKSKSCSDSAEENIGEKFELLKELADKIVRDVEAKDDKNNVSSDDSKMTELVKFDEDGKNSSDTSFNRESKMKRLQISSAANAAVSEKIIKELSLKKTVEPPVKIAGEKCPNVKYTKPEAKGKENPVDAAEVGLMPSPSLLTSDDEVDLATRRQKQKSEYLALEN